MDNIKVKITSLLHDPIDKILEIQKHANRAMDYASKIFGITDKDILGGIKCHHIPTDQGSISYCNNIDRDFINIIRKADINASAANRTLILGNPKNFSENIISIYHPLSTFELLKLDSSQAMLRKDIIFANIKKAIDDLLPGNSFSIKHFDLDTFNKLFSDLPLVYYRILTPKHAPGTDVFKQWISYFPEDSRMPISSILSHLQMTSAIASILNSGGTFILVYLDIGGVQEFIKKSRKTTDLWAASYLVSLLVYYVIYKFAKKYGADAFIMPWLPSIPLAKATLFGKHVKDEDLIHSQVPNSFLLLIPVTDVCDIDCRDMESMELCEMEQKRILDELYREIVGSEDGEKGYLSETLDEIISVANDYIKEKTGRSNVITGVEIGDIIKKVRLAGILCKINDGELLCYSKAYIKLGNEPEIGLGKIQEFLRDERNRELVQYKNWRAMKDFPTLIRLLQKAMFMSKYRFRAYRNEMKLQKEKKFCTLCNFREPLDKEVLVKLNDEIAGIVDPDERLCGVCLLKRIFRYILPEVLDKLFNDKKSSEESDESGKQKKKFSLAPIHIPSTVEFGTIWFKVTILLLRDPEILNKVKDVVSAFKKLKEEIADKDKGLYKLLQDYGFKEERLNKLRELYDLLIRYKKGTVNDFRILPLLAEEYADAEILDFLRIPGEFLIEESLVLYASNLIKLQNELMEELPEDGKKKFKEVIRHLDNSHKEKSVEEYKYIDALQELFALVSKKIKSVKSEEVFSRFINVVEKIGVIRGDNKIWDFVRSIGLPLSVKPQNRFVILMTDGDNMGKAIAGERNPPLILTYSRGDYKNIVESVLSKITNKDVFNEPYPVSPSTLTLLSMIISEHTKIVKTIVESFGGFLVYSGGDDVLALLPPETWHIVYMLLRFTFSAEFIKIYFEDEISLRKESVSGYKYKLGLSWRMTSSFGVVIAPPKYDLKRAISRARDLLEEHAKKLEVIKEKVRVKDGLAVELLSRGGSIAFVKGVPNILIKDDNNELLYVKEYDDKFMREIENSVNNGFGAVIELIQRTQKKLTGSEHLNNDVSFYGLKPKIGGTFIKDFVKEERDKMILEIPDLVSPIDIALRIVKGIKAGKFSTRIIYDLIDFVLEYTTLGEMSVENNESLLQYLYYKYKRSIIRRLKDRENNVAKKELVVLMDLLKYLIEHDDNLRGIPFLAKVLDRTLNNAIIIGGE